MILSDLSIKVGFIIFVIKFLLKKGLEKVDTPNFYHLELVKTSPSIAVVIMPPCFTHYLPKLNQLNQGGMIHYLLNHESRAQN